MTKIIRSSRERGQSVVLVVLMLMGLIAMLALVLDGGNFYTQRRAAQLAADAGALAGAREYCLTENSTAAVNRGFEYSVTRNQAEDAEVNVVGEDVTVNTTITFDTFFLGILGIPELTATATATAACSPASEAYVLPIAYSCQKNIYGEGGGGGGGGGGEDDDEYCAVYFWDDKDQLEDCDIETGDPPGDYIYIIVDSVAQETTIQCLEPDGTIPTDDPEEGEIEYVDCNFDDDGDNDVELLSGGGKSWLDIGAIGAEPPELIDWIQNGLGTPIEPYTWFAGQSGVANTVYRALDDYTLNTQVVVPVFNAICDGYPPTNCPAQYPDSDVETVSETASMNYYHVISFALFYPSCVEAAGIPGSCPINDFLEMPPNVKTMEGCFIEGFDGDLGAGGGSVDTGADVVYLKE